jgi:hypothetical protein
MRPRSRCEHRQREGGQSGGVKINWPSASNVFQNQNNAMEQDDDLYS